MIRSYVAAALRRRWRALFVMVLVLGVLGGSSLAAFAGARRTASAYSRFLEAGHPSDLAINNFSDEAQDPTVFDEFPEVERTRTWVAFNLAVLDSEGQPVFDDAGGEAVGSVDGQFFTQDRVGIIEGRMSDPDEVGEVVVSEFAREVEAFEVGDRVTVAIYTDEQLEDELFFESPTPPFDEIELTVVGVAVFPDEVVQDESDRIPRYLLTPAFTAQQSDAGSYAWNHVVLRGGDADIPAVQERFVDLLPEDSGAVFRVHSADVARAQRAVRPGALALGILGAAAAIATIALIAQGLVRQVRSEAANDDVLRALGATRRTIWAIALVLAGIPVLLGSALAVLLAVAVSPASPIGPVRRIEVDRGLSADWAVLGLGVLAFTLALIGVAVLAIATQARARRGVTRPSRSVQAVAAAGLPPAAVVGTRLALEPGTGSTAVPVRSVLAGTVLVIAALVAALCFSASLDSLVSTPRLYGWDWDATLLDTAGYGGIDPDATAELLDDDPRIDDWTGVYFGADDIDGLNVPLLGVDPRAGIGPPILTGRAVADDDEIVVGTGTLEALGKEVGDDVELDGGGRPTVVRIVGTASFPAVGQVHGNHPSLGVGGLVGPELVPGALTDTFGPPAVFVRYTEGTDRDGADAWLREETQGIGEFPGSTEVFRSRRPAEITNSDDIGAAPALVAATLGVAALASLALVLSVSTSRRRRDLALLKALGFTKRDVSTAVAWQATVTIGVGLLFGIPIGVVAGRWLWQRFVEQLYVVPAPEVPFVALVALVAAALVLCNLVGAAPGRAAGRIPASSSLRAE
ncbi:MAG TPA: ABC transporter permease [Ilumatobacteraceae bacterium]|nr:ABC transporter permease [Ilumatobacteraceae bacterium]